MWAFPMFMIPVTLIRACIVFKRGAVKDKQVNCEAQAIHGALTRSHLCLSASSAAALQQQARSNFDTAGSGQEQLSQVDQAKKRLDGMQWTA